MQWISVDSGKMPEAEEEVLVYCNRNGVEFVCPAIHEDGTVSTEDSKWFWYDLDFEYDEENDKYMIPEGWWENRHFTPDDVYNNQIDCSVTHWRPLPDLPKKSEDIDETPTVDLESLPIVRELREKLARYEQLEAEGRIKVLPESKKGTCGSCWHFRRIPGTRRGTCDIKDQRFDRWGNPRKEWGEFEPAQSRIACKQYKDPEDLEE